MELNRHNIYNNTLFQFGAGVLLDPLWSINAQVKATNRSRNFGKTLTFFLDHIETDLLELQQTEDQDRAMQENRTQAGKTLLQLVRVLAGDDLASWVETFLDETAQKSGEAHLHHDQGDVCNY